MLKILKPLTKNKAGAVQSKPALGNNTKSNSNTPKKSETVLSAFLTGKSYNRFEAEIQLHDHCLHSTISYFVNSKGIDFDRKWETVSGYMGAPTRVKRYKLKRDADNIRRARKLLESEVRGAL